MNLKHLFLPTEENDHTPHLLQKTAILMMAILVMLSFAVVNLQALLWQSSDWLVGTVLPAVVVDLTNDERQDLAEVPLRRSSVLDEAARLKAEHMAKNSYFAHYSPTGVSPWFWFDKAGYTYAHAGENLAIHFKDSGAVVNAWMDSPSHRANIVNSNYTEIGVGTAKGTFDGFETVFVVQLFGTPALPALVVVKPPIVTPTAVAAAVTPTASEIELTEEILPNELVAGAETELALPSTIVEPEEVITLDINEGSTRTVALAVTEKPLEIAEVAKDNNQTSIFSTHFSTSSGLEPIIGTVSGTTAYQTNFIGSIATRPSVLLQTTYLFIGLFVAFLLFSSVIIGIRHHRPLQVVYGVALLFLMSGLFYVHSSLTASVVVAAETELKITL